MAVADGLGGAAFGELASMLALRTGWDIGPTAIKWSWIITEKEVEDLKERLELTFRRMDRALLDHAKVDPGCTGMGTTLTGAFTVGPEAFIAHVGDSRAYLFHAGQLTRVTRDHTLAQQCIDMGVPITKKSWYHTLTNCIGSGEGLFLEFHHLRLSDEDRLLLCTDGLTDMVKEEEIARMLGRHKDPQETAQVLVDMALAKGGRDNVTVVLAQYATPDSDAVIV
jgi:protein phosphatase